MFFSLYFQFESQNIKARDKTQKLSNNRKENIKMAVRLRSDNEDERKRG